MKNSKIAPIASLLALVSLPAMAGPNWDVIHKAEADKAAHKHEPALVMPLDHGPRAITTPWQNELWLSQLISQIQLKKPVDQAAAKQQSIAVAAHTHRDLPSHS